MNQDVFTENPSPVSYTPMMRQYYSLKEKCPDSILFFRMGDFYEIFGDEAVEVGEKLDIVVTSRERGDSQRIKFCGVPHHSAAPYWLKLVKMGYKIAIADQTEAASEAKGLVKRDIVKILTPGCIDELEALEATAPNYILAVYEDPATKAWGVALADPSTGELRTGSAATLEEVLGVIETFQPKELLIRRFCTDQFRSLLKPYLSSHPLVFSQMPEGILRDPPAQMALIRGIVGQDSLIKLSIQTGAQESIAGLFAYLQSLQMSLSQFVRVSPLVAEDRMNLSETTIRDLELFETIRSRKAEGSLFYHVNQCMTPMGARLLRWNLARPHVKPEAIQKSQTDIAALLKYGEDFVRDLRLLLHGTADLERLVTRLCNRSVKPKDLAQIRDALRRALRVAHHFQSADTQTVFLLGQDPESIQSLLIPLEESLLEEIGVLGAGSQIFRPGYDSLLDEKNELSQHGAEKVEEYLEQLKKETQIQSLKVREHKTFGLLLEVTKSNLDRVPKHFLRKQTMVGGERYITEALVNLHEELSSAQDLAILQESRLYEGLITSLCAHTQSLKVLSEALAQLDLLQSHSWLAIKQNFTRPLKAQGLKLQGARHPVVEYFVGKQRFEPNDIEMGESSKQLLITGPNMAGKSTAMRQTALCAILNQAGGYVPARHAELPIFDNIYTRVGAADDLSQGLSTFMVEMKESAFILRQATPNSLVILDEVGRGTSSEDGVAIASAILEELGSRLNSWTLFATHYHELTGLTQRLPALRLIKTEVLEANGGIHFTHRLVEGACSSSYGIEVARLAGIPDSVVSKARNYLSVPKNQTSQISSGSKNMLESRSREILSRLERVRIHRMTPLQALNTLNELVDLSRGSVQDELFPEENSLF